MNLFIKYTTLSTLLVVGAKLLPFPADASPLATQENQRGSSQFSKTAQGASQHSKSSSPIEAQEEAKQRVQERARLQHTLSKTDVQLLQQRLTERLGTPLTQDGILGPRTQAALREYQQKNNLEVTARPDAETLESLGF